MDDGKREHRERKRTIKRLGNQRRRRQLKQAIAEDPDTALDAEFDFGRYESAQLNGIDHDATRRPRS